MLTPRDQQVAELLLRGCDNAEIAKELRVARRTVKAHFSRLFLQFGINGGIKRVKLAVLFDRRQACQELAPPADVTAIASRRNRERDSHPARCRGT
jgi:FixJ family two-component response regulator